MTRGIIEEDLKRIIEKHGKEGWIRSNECVKIYMKLFPTNEKEAARLRYFRFRRKVEDGKIPGFQIKKLPSNFSFIGLGSADPNIFEDVKSDDKQKTPEKKRLGLFGYLNQREIRGKEKQDRKIRELKARFEIVREVNEIKKKKKITQEERYAVEKKWRERFGLD